MSNLWQIIINYFFVQISILLFICPFYFVYLYKHKNASIKNIFFNCHIEDFLSSKQANYMIYIWAGAEAICWFIIPEFLLLLIIFLRVRNKKALLIYDILGTIAGTFLGLFISIFLKFNIATVPYITQSMVDQAKIWYQGLGLFGLFFQPFSGVPYKVFVATISGFHINLFLFLILAVFIRIARYYIFYTIFVNLYPFWHNFISKNYIPIFLSGCFIFSFMFLKVYRSYGPSYTPNDDNVYIIKNIRTLLPAKLQNRSIYPP